MDKVCKTCSFCANNECNHVDSHSFLLDVKESSFCEFWSLDTDLYQKEKLNS